MGDKVSLFDNERKMAWMRYFSEKTALDVETLKLIDKKKKNRMELLHEIPFCLKILYYYTDSLIS